MSKNPHLEQDLQRYYNEGREKNRLTQALGRLELARTQEIIKRYLPKAPQTILDIGGGAGVYALWLARLGYTVHLVDVVPLHIEQALAAADTQPESPLASAQVGDARALDFPDACADVVLLLGPLYHLPERDQRVQALHEAWRVLRPSGLLFAATISRFASLVDGLRMGYLADDMYAGLVKQVLQDGRHANPTGQRGYFTTAYFHHPAEIREELEEASFTVNAVLAIEGPASFLPDLDMYWRDENLRERVLALVRTVESDPSMLGATGHLLAVAQKS
jgi:ubiquinone/menaquinone biosynthesis C-methylase UbiE